MISILGRRTRWKRSSNGSPRRARCNVPQNGPSSMYKHQNHCRIYTHHSHVPLECWRVCLYHRKAAPSQIQPNNRGAKRAIGRSTCSQMRSLFSPARFVHRNAATQSRPVPRLSPPLLTSWCGTMIDRSLGASVGRPSVSSTWSPPTLAHGHGKVDQMSSCWKVAGREKTVR